MSEFLVSNCPDVCVKTVIKDVSEWDDFIDSLCRSYGFQNSYHPLIYLLEGKLIGGLPEFKDHVKEKYDNKRLQITNEAKKARQAIIENENKEKMRKKNDGDTLCEKIDDSISKVLKKPVTYLIQDAFYNLKFEKGIPFQIRETNLLCSQDLKVKNKEGEKVAIHNHRMLNVPDEMAAIEKECKQQAYENVRKDKTFDQFMTTYKLHIEGKIDPHNRVGDRPETAPWDPTKEKKRPVKQSML